MLLVLYLLLLIIRFVNAQLILLLKVTVITRFVNVTMKHLNQKKVNFQYVLIILNRQVLDISLTLNVDVHVVLLVRILQIQY